MPKVKVMVVDDEADVLSTTARMLEFLGFEPVLVQSAEKLLERVKQENPDILLQDIMMRGLNLAKFLEDVKSNPDTAHIKLLIFSAVDDLTTYRASPWVDGLLRKPFGLNDMKKALSVAAKN